MAQIGQTVAVDFDRLRQVFACRLLLRHGYRHFAVVAAAHILGDGDSHNLLDGVGFGFVGEKGRRDFFVFAVHEIAEQAFQTVAQPFQKVQPRNLHQQRKAQHGKGKQQHNADRVTEPGAHGRINQRANQSARIQRQAVLQPVRKQRGFQYGAAQQQNCQSCQPDGRVVRRSARIEYRAEMAVQPHAHGHHTPPCGQAEQIVKHIRQPCAQQAAEIARLPQVRYVARP